MRWIIGRWLASLAVLFLLFGTRAAADAVPVGAVSFDQLSPGTSGALYGIDVFNATQAGGGSTVSTFLNFNNLALTVLLSDNTSQTIALTAVDPSGDSSSGALFAAGDVVSATLTGTFLPTTVTLADGSVVTIQASFSALLTDPIAGSVQSGDFALISANTVVQGVPEPGTLTLLGISLFCLAQCFWLIRRKEPWVQGN